MATRRRKDEIGCRMGGSARNTAILVSIVLLVFIISEVVASSAKSSSGSFYAGEEEGRYEKLPPTVFAPGGRLYMVEKSARAASSLEDISAPLSVALLCDNGESVVVVSTRSRSPHAHYKFPPKPSTETSELLLGDEETNATEKNATLKADKNNTFEMPLLLEDMDDPNEYESRLGEGETRTSNSPLSLASSSPLCLLAPRLLAVTGGNSIDSIVLLRRIQEAALSLHKSNFGGAMMGTGDFGASSVESYELGRRLADSFQIATQSVGGKGGRILAVR
jgi:hypothetical protein